LLGRKGDREKRDLTQSGRDVGEREENRERLKYGVGLWGGFTERPNTGSL